MVRQILEVVVEADGIITMALLQFQVLAVVV
jgi:hypothetical protein